MTKRTQSSGYLVAAACLATAGAAQATVVTTPTSLSSGDTYRLVFVTSPDFRITGSSINVDDYNTLANQAAASVSALAALDTDWFAIVSTPGDSGVDAKTNTGTDDSPAGDNGVPIFLLDGTTLVADHYDDLWDGNIDSAIDITEDGTPASGTSANDFVVWTGTAGDGTVNTAQPLGSNFFAGRGEWGQRDSRWIGTFGGNENSELGLYVISDVLTVADTSTPLIGDADGDGDVDDSDLGIAISNFTGPDGTGKTRAQGDVDGDGDVDDSDLGLAISNFTGPLSPASVPEPSALALLGLSGSMLLKRRSRASK